MTVVVGERFYGRVGRVWWRFLDERRLRPVAVVAHLPAWTVDDLERVLSVAGGR